MPSTYDLTDGGVALLVVDMTSDFLTEGTLMELAEGRDIVGNVNALVDRCHELGTPVVFIRQEFRESGVDIGRMADGVPPMLDDLGRPTTLRGGSAGVGVFAPVSHDADDIDVVKHRQSGFFETDLDTVLRGLNAKTIVITGIASCGCCFATALDGMFRGYQVVFVSDATTVGDLPDVGYGAHAGTDVHNVTLTLTSLIVGEVCDTSSLLERLVAPPLPRVPIGAGPNVKPT